MPSRPDGLGSSCLRVYISLIAFFVIKFLYLRPINISNALKLMSNIIGTTTRDVTIDESLPLSSSNFS